MFQWKAAERHLWQLFMKNRWRHVPVTFHWREAERRIPQQLLKSRWRNQAPGMFEWKAVERHLRQLLMALVVQHLLPPSSQGGPGTS
ncbi:hypothetical protein ISCGN_031177 [Ixodes scapularis]